MESFFVRNLPKFILLAVVFGFGTFITTFSMTKYNKHIPDWMILPQISLTGNNYPESQVYMWGFGCLSAIMIVLGSVLHLSLIRKLIAKGKRPCKLYNFSCFFLLVIAAGGLATQGAIPLQKNFYDVLLYGSSKVTVEETTVIHLTSASIFFVSALGYMFISSLLMKKAPELRHHGFSEKRYHIKVILTIVYAVCVMVTNKWFKHVADKKNGILVSSIAQWSAVSSLLFFFLTYYFDVKEYLSKKASSDAKTKKKKSQ